MIFLRKIRPILLGFVFLPLYAQADDPLHEAVQDKNYEAIRSSRGLDINLQDQQGRTPLSIAVSMEDEIAVRELLNKTFPEEEMILGIMDPGTPLDPVQFVSSPSSIDLLIPDNNGDTVLHRAVAVDNTSIAKQLLTHVLHSPNLKKLLNATNGKGRTALLEAVRAEKVDMAKVLIDVGADPNIPDVKGENPLHRAISQYKGPHRSGPDYKKEDFKMIELIMSVGRWADPNIPHKKTGDTAIHMAAADPEVLELLFDSGFEIQVDARNKDGYTPLFLAVVRESTDVAEMLLKKGANPNAQNGPKKVTALHLIANLINYYPIDPELLFKYNVDPNIPDIRGWTPLHYAVYAGGPVESLISRGANPHIPNDKGETSLDFVDLWNGRVSFFEVKKTDVEAIEARKKSMIEGYRKWLEKNPVNCRF